MKNPENRQNNEDFDSLLKRESPESQIKKVGIASAIDTREKSKQNNQPCQDAIFCDEKNGIAIVCDGMGGHTAGDVASNLACKSIAEKLEVFPNNLENSKKYMANVLEQVNKEIRNEAKTDLSKFDMGTTASVVKIWQSEGERKAIIGNVGDSRVYIINREGNLTQITLDDNQARGDYNDQDTEQLAIIKAIQEKLSSFTDESEFTADDIRYYRFRNIISQALGMQGEISPHVDVVDVNNGDRLFICSDGISDNLTNRQIEQILSASANRDEAVKKLIAEAKKVSLDISNKRHNDDDMSAVLIEV